MFLTKDKINQCSFKQETKEAILSVYPDGAELMDILDLDNYDKKENYFFLTFFILSKEEQEKCYKTMHIFNSSNIQNSLNVQDSDRVFNSESVRVSNTVTDSTSVNESSFIIESNYIDHCTETFQSSFINNSQNVICSKQVIESSSVFNSLNIFHGNNIISSQDITDSFFCRDCFQLSNCLFCVNLKNENHCLFNKPIDQDKLDAIIRQYKNWMKQDLVFIEDWRFPRIRSKIDLRPSFQKIPESFWTWVKTLPNYDPEVLYKMTFLPDFIK